MTYTVSELPARFVRNIRIDAETGCWLWTRAQTGLGYCQTTWNGHVIYVHRLIYALMTGPIPDGRIIDHLCRCRNCCNPAHLEPVTHRVNTLRGNTIAAINVAKTHCPAGHSYDEANTRVYRGYRHCRACDRGRGRRRRLAQKLRT